MARNCIPAIALIAGLGWHVGVAMATPLEECSTTDVPVACLDAKLKEANLRLNATLKAAQERIEQLQQDGRRPVMGAFVDSQRKFNAYRDAQCAWQAIHAAPGGNPAEYVKDCQIRATVAREQELNAFASGVEAPPAVAAVPMSETGTEEAAVTESAPVMAEKPATIQPAEAPPPAPADSPAPVRRGAEWRLTDWIVNGVQRQLVADSNVTIAFDPSGKLSGNASINAYSGNFRFDAEGRLQWPRTGFTLTRMTGPPDLLAQERAFLDSLRRTVHYHADGQQLVLESANKAIVLTFSR
ncbi:MAG TPA: META domain-containing protein [Burkholderiales bacterium]|nr:META domain-containing protein [Burkholderiales bacterium]